jgi:hypothetical protein
MPNNFIVLRSASASHTRELVSGIIIPSAVNLKQMDGLVAFKEKTDKLKLRLTDAWAEIKQLKSDIAVADLSLNSPCVMCSDLRSDKAALEQQLSDTRQRASMRLHCAEVVSHFKRKAGAYKRQMLKAKCNWAKWSKRVKAIRSECERKVSLVVSERDAALADNVVYIDQILAAFVAKDHLAQIVGCIFFNCFNNPFPCLCMNLLERRWGY